MSSIISTRISSTWISGRQKKLNKRPPIEVKISTLLQEGNEEAVSLIYDNYGAVLFGLCARMMGSKEDGEEVFQEAMIKIWRYAKSFDPSKARLYTWMMNVTRNTCIDQIRKNDRRPQIQDIDSNVYKVDSVNQGEIEVDHIGLKKEIDKLRPEERKVLELAYFKGFTQGEIAKDLNIPLGTVKTRARKAITELKRFLAKDIGS